LLHKLQTQPEQLPRNTMRSSAAIENERAACPLKDYQQWSPFLLPRARTDLAFTTCRRFPGARPQYKEGIAKVSISCSAFDRGVRERSDVPRRTRQRHRQAQVKRQLQRL